MISIAFLVRYWPFFGGRDTVTRLLASELLRRVDIFFDISKYDTLDYIK